MASRPASSTSDTGAMMLLIWRGRVSSIFYRMKIKIKSKKIKNRFIYGDLLANKKAKSIVIFLSGFSGSGEMPLLKNASKYFFRRGFSTIGFNFCNDNDGVQRKDAVKPEEMTLAIYPAELKAVIDALGKKYSKIVLVGHSFGAIASILFLAKYKKYRKDAEIILWEPSFLPWKREWMKEDFYFDKESELYHTKYSKEKINRTFYNECIKTKSTTGIFKSLEKRVCIVATTKIGKKNAKEYFLGLHNKKDSKLVFINGAGHSFESKKHQKKLFNETISFLKAR